ncbi:MAG TPA: hypothetical protein DHN33_10440, partial [Eubacteriaceae bacterium]|nr:hypothetical protein [Eubacteriaceae bacterium]
MKKTTGLSKKILLMAVVIFSLFLFACTLLPAESAEEKYRLPDFLDQGYQLIEVDGGELSGERKANAIVDVGFGNREYYAMTNEYGQLVRVVANEIVLQDDDREPVTDRGRYYREEAHVPGVESPNLDQGHVIADSMGGVSNAYNITPQNSTLNRHGDQAYMEDVIRKAGGCKNFEAVISYPNNRTMIPSHYRFQYEIRGRLVVDEYPNANPDLINKQNNADSKDEMNKFSSEIQIVDLDKKAEYIVLENTGNEEVNLKGWTIVSVRGDQRFVFESKRLKPGEQVIVGDQNNNSFVDHHWLEG